MQFHQAEADAGIVRFCSDPKWQNVVIVPPVGMGNHKTAQGKRKVTQITGTVAINLDSNGKPLDHLWLYIFFAESRCMGSFTFSQDDCLRNFRSILNNCDTSGLFPKHGGIIQDVCSVYRMTARPAGGPSPFFMLGSDPRTAGVFTCNDTDVSALPDSPLNGTCTCWYSGMDSVTAVFNKPEGGCSAVQSTSNPRTN